MKSRSLSRPAPAAAGLPVPAASAVPPLAPVAALLVASGALGLMYEVLWQRQFALLFGSGGPATALVLAAYFGGLGLGSLAAGRWAERVRRPLRAYALLEAVVGLGALLVPALLAGAAALYAPLLGGGTAAPFLVNVVRILLAFGAIAVPTLAMGATLPLLGSLVDAGRRELGVTAGALYVANTFGAACGALAVPFVLLRLLGLEATTWVCVAGNGLLAATAWTIDRRRQTPALTTMANAPAVLPRRKVAPADRLSAPARTGTGAGAAFFSGVATFALQVLWNRAFAQVHENSLYSFAVIVAVVILALAFGGYLARLGLSRGARAPVVLGWSWLIGGVLTWFTPAVFVSLTDGLAYLPGAGGWAGHARSLFGLAVVVLLVPMALLGSGLPAILQAAGRQAATPTARVIGRLLAVNIAGAVAGALLAGFVLPHLLGLWLSIACLGGGLAVAGLHHLRPGRCTWLGGAAAVGGVLALRALDLPVVQLAANERLVAVAEGTHGIVAVVERPDSRRLKLNNHYALGGSAATGDERMQSHLPLLLHPAPRRVAYLGLGTGISAGGAQFHPVEQLTLIELVPEVAEAARRHFAAENLSVVTDPKTRLVIDDARHHLRARPAPFDVIIGDLVIPWQEGEGALFTLEHFRAARAALAPDGIYCQWLPLFQLSEEEFRIIVRTFLEVFPATELWRGDFSPTEPALALVGSAPGWRSRPETVRQRLAEQQPDPTNPHLVRPEAVWMHWIGPLRSAEFAGDLRLNTEDRPWVQLLGPLQHGGDRRNPRFVGRHLEVWLEAQRRQARGEHPLAPEQERGLTAAAHFGEALLCLAAGDAAGMRAARAGLQQVLPPELHQLLLP